MLKTAFITGITGQDGSYLAELLLNKGYNVHGLIRRSSSSSNERISHLIESSSPLKFWIHYGDISDSLNIINLLRLIKPDEIYNLAAMSHVGVSFDIPEYSANIDGIGLLRILEAVKILDLNKTKIYQASTSELFGKAQEIPQTEKTPFYPRSPYGVAKLYAYWIAKNYREAYDIFVSNGILFNHESERRGENFVTRKITLGVSKIKYGLQKKLTLGNLDSKRDWGYAKDFVYGMWLMLQEEKPDDYILATGKTHSVREFVNLAFKCIDVDVEWQGSGINEIGINAGNGQIVVEVNKDFFRPTEVDILIGDSTKAREILGWNPNKTSFEKLVKLMMSHDLEFVKQKKK